jgi:plasmid stabilization system protein ParE
MTKYRVIITPGAEDDLRAAYYYLRERSPRAARTWIRGLRQKIKTLEFHPERVPLAFESAVFRQPIRSLLYGSGNRGTYRILFVVIDHSVFVLHVRHGARLPLEPPG